MSMIKQRRTFDAEFKRMAVELSQSRENMRTLAKELDIRVELLYRWRQELLDKKEASFPGRGNVSLSPLEAENARLKKQLKDAELERDILKKAVSIFSKNDGKFFGS
jgi:transposase